MTVRAAWLTNRGDAAGGQTRNDSRMTPLGTMTPAGELTTTPGVIPGGNPFALNATGPMTATLGTGRAVVQGTDIQGAYPAAITAPETLVFVDGDPTNPRIDLVVLRVYDTAFDASGQVRPAVEIIPGTPAAAPVPPAAPAGALGLYRVAVPAAASAGSGGIDFPAATTDLRRPTVAVGGINPNPDAPGAYRAQYRDNGTGLQRWSGNAWVGMAAELVTWTKVSLAGGYGHNGNSNGDVRYRVIDLLGTRFVQWRGGMNVSYRGGTPVRDGAFLSAALPTLARPTGLRSVPVACSAADSTIVTVKIDFLANGTATLLSDDGDAPPWVSLHGVMYPL
ncbi:hypothetical protein WKI65_32880 [Streptomyces sp. MS1.AVA.3]|uniref:hypothetical protein n=1 Tax=Streptomyces decoyicus TaxID=249567 RepID=UPI0030C38B90